MQKNYLTEKTNTYRYGVFMGNYVEEIYAKDFKGKKLVNNNFPLTETQEKFHETALQRQQQDDINTVNQDDQDINFEDLDVYDPLKATKLLYRYTSTNDDKLKDTQKDLRFQTSYQLSYQYGIEPQSFTRNDIHGDLKSTQKIKEKNIKDQTLRLERENQPQKQEEIVRHNKKDQHFSRTFDKPHLSVGFRI